MVANYWNFTLLENFLLIPEFSSKNTKFGVKEYFDLFEFMSKIDIVFWKTIFWHKQNLRRRANCPMPLACDVDVNDVYSICTAAACLYVMTFLRTYWVTLLWAVLPRRRPYHVLMLSVCLSVCPVPPPRGKTKRPTNTKLGRKGPWDTSTPWTNFKVKGSEVKVTAVNCVVGKTMLSIWYDNWLCGSHVLNCKDGPIAGGLLTAGTLLLLSAVFLFFVLNEVWLIMQLVHYMAYHTCG